MLGPLGFSAPLVLGALIALPALWFLLRAIPPAPKVRVFPAVALLMGLKDATPLAQRTPWWLLLLRTLAIAALILAAAGPIWRPEPSAGGSGPLLVIVDGGWAAAPNWAERQARAVSALEGASGAGRPVALLIADREGGKGPLAFGDGAELAATIRAAQPKAWATGYPSAPDVALAAAPDRFDTLWISDGLDHDARSAWLTALVVRGRVTVVPPSASVRSLQVEPGDHPSLIARSTTGGPMPTVNAVGPDPQGTGRVLAALQPPEPELVDGVWTAKVPIDLPSELRNRVTAFALANQDTAGAVVLADDTLRRRKVALIGEVRDTEGQALLSPLHYLRRALAPSSDLIEGGLSEVIPAAPDVIIIADQPAPPDPIALREWVERGGTLIRFAGARLAASEALNDDPLLPVRLRPGGRDAGGALSWGTPRGIAPFPADGVFAGLNVPADVMIRAQMLPEPDPALAGKTIAQLADGTPLVTRESLGQGQIVMFHTSADAEWSNLPLSGLFVQMMTRIVQSARASAATDATTSAEAPFWTAETLLDGFGREVPVGDLPPVSAQDFAAGAGPVAPAGVYVAGARQTALNAGGPMAIAPWPGAVVEQADMTPGQRLGVWLLIAAALAFMLDVIASAFLAGQRRSLTRRRAA